MSPTRFAAALALTLCLAPVARAQEGAASSTTISIDAKGRDLSEILDALGQEHGLNYVVARAAVEAAGALDCRLVDVPLDQAVQMLCAACNLEATIQGRFVIIRKPREGERPRFTVPDAELKAVPRPREATGERRDGISDILKRPEPAPPKAPELPQDRIAVGKVVSKTDKGIVVEDVDGKQLTFDLPGPDEVDTAHYVELQRALRDRVEAGRRVSLTYLAKGGRNVIANLLVGRDPRDTSTTRMPEPDSEE